jgi:hypothetical protein
MVYPFLLLAIARFELFVRPRHVNTVIGGFYMKLSARDKFLKKCTDHPCRAADPDLAFSSVTHFSIRIAGNMAVK